MTYSFQKSNALALIFILVAFVSLPLLGQEKDAPPVRTNFSGRWRMVKEKSQFNGFKVPDAIIRVVDHHDPLLNLHTIQTTGKHTTMTDVSYFTDNSVTMNTINGRDAQCRAFWDGPALIVRTKMLTTKGEREVIEDRWELSADGKTLTTTSHIAIEAGEATLVLVCEKEEK